MPASCSKIDRIEMCTTSTEVCHSQEITNSQQLWTVCKELMVCNRMQEEVWVLCTNSRGRIVAYAMVTKGSVDEAMVVIGDMLRIVLASGTRNFFMVHNHPSGDPEPPKEDIQFTHGFVRAGKLLDIEVIDHVIVGTERLHSLRQERHF